MNITIAIYSFHKDQVYIKVPFGITKETDKCYFTHNGARYLKSEIGKPILKSPTRYTYLQLVMVDADESELRAVLSRWFVNKGAKVWSMKNRSET